MGIIDKIRRVAALPSTLAAYSATRSPFVTDSHLAELTAPAAPATVTRDLAMQIPAVIRARTLIVTTVARTPLVALDGGDAPAWMTATTPTGGHAQTQFHRHLWTADDLLFHGSAAWAIERDLDGNPVAAVHIPRALWSIDTDGHPVVDGRRVDPAEVAVFEGIHSGILDHGAPSLRDGRLILRAAARVADSPAALIELRQTNDAELSDSDIEALIGRYVRARRGERHGVSFSSTGIEVHEHSLAKENLLIEGRNAAAVDIARLVGVPAPFIDASVGGTSLSYENAQSRMTELLTFGVAPILAAISARLNLPDLTSDGMGVKFDTASILNEIPLAAKETA